MPEWIESLRVGARQEEFLPLFVESLNAFFQIKNLNLLLLSLDSSLRNRTPIEAKPDLTPLLNLRPREALEEFQRIYLNYHLKKHSDNRNETARALGVAYSTLKSQIRALRKK
jgi:DNA-binding NtrC family response regulator